jgi:hypothetical protein
MSVFSRRFKQAEDLPSARVSPWKMRAVICFITCLTRGTIVSDFLAQALEPELHYGVR